MASFLQTVNLRWSHKVTVMSGDNFEQSFVNKREKCFWSLYNSYEQNKINFQILVNCKFYSGHIDTTIILQADSLDHVQ